MSGDPSPFDPPSQREPAPSQAAPSQPASASDPPGKLANIDAAEVALRISGLTTAGAPLAAGIMALAEDWPNRRVAARLRAMARRLAAGQPLEQAVGALGSPELERLLVRSAEQGQIARALEGFLRIELQNAAIRRELWGVFGYSAVLLGTLAGWLYFMTVWLGPMFGDIFEDFGIELPVESRSLIWFARLGWWRLAAIMLAPLGMIAAARLVLGRGAFYRLAQWLPLLGPILRWQGLIAWGSILRILVEQQEPLDAALRVAAGAAREAGLRRASEAMAQGVRLGRPISQCASEHSVLPPTLSPLLAWGEKSRSLAEALGVAIDFWWERLASRLRMARGILPPIVFVIILCVVDMVLASLLLPLVRLIGSLSN